MTYRYRASIYRVIDGDTVELDVDCGFFVRFRSKFRLLGIDAPEKNQAGGGNANVYLTELLSIAAKEGDGFIQIETTKPDKYGRWLVTLFFNDGSTINQRMIEAGHAVPYPPR